jgi:transcriptional regulator with XRE-family HTH domain
MNTDTSLANLSAVIRYGRKRAGLSQVEFAKAIGITQGTISKIESAQLSVDARTWFEICDLVKIPYECLRTGTIDLTGFDVAQDVSRVGKFRIPERYGKYAGSTVRTIVPFLRFFSKHAGEAATEDYIRYRKLEPDYFVQLNNPLNVRFIGDFIQMMSDRHVLTQENLPELASHFAASPIHRPFKQDYENMAPMQMLAALIDQLPNYEKNYRYRLESLDQRSAVFSTKPEAHVHELKIDSEIAQTMCRYRQTAIAEFVVQHAGVPTVTVHESECYYRGGSRCVHQLAI